MSENAAKTEQQEDQVLSPRWEEALLTPKRDEEPEPTEQERQAAAAAEDEFNKLAGITVSAPVTPTVPDKDKDDAAKQSTDKPDETTAADIDKPGDTPDDKPETVSFSKEQFEELQTALEFVKQLQGGESEFLSGLHQTVDQKLEAQNQKLTGKLGELNRAIQERGQPAKLTREQFKKLSEVYEPELIDALVEDLSGIVLQQPAQVNQDELLKSLQEELNASFLESMKDKIVTPEQLQETALLMSDYTNEQILNFAVPGWQKKIADKAYDEFIDSLQSGKAKEIEASNDPSVLVKTIQDFDTWKAGKDQQNQQRQKEKDEKQAALEKAQQPKGGGSPPTKTDTDTEEAAAEAEFQRLEASRL